MPTPHARNPGCLLGGSCTVVRSPPRGGDHWRHHQDHDPGLSGAESSDLFALFLSSFEIKSMKIRLCFISFKFNDEKDECVSVKMRTCSLNAWKTDRQADVRDIRLGIVHPDRSSASSLRTPTGKKKPLTLSFYTGWQRISARDLDIPLYLWYQQTLDEFLS